MARDREEAGSESSRKMQDKEETTSEASWTAVVKRKRKKECGGWNQRVKRKGLKPQLRGAGVKGVSVYPESESCHGQARAKMARKARENQTKMEEQADGKVPGEEGGGDSESRNGK